MECRNHTLVVFKVVIFLRKWKYSFHPLRVKVKKMRLTLYPKNMFARNQHIYHCPIHAIQILPLVSTHFSLLLQREYYI
jgi:hypothetical protein